MDKCELWDNYDVPMKVLESISSLRNMRILTCIDVNYNVVVYIPQLSRIKDKKYLSNLEGRGRTYRDACIDFLINLMDKEYNIRYKKDYYITREIRSKVMRMNVGYLYERGENETCLKDLSKNCT